VTARVYKFPSRSAVPTAAERDSATAPGGASSPLASPGAGPLSLEFRLRRSVRALTAGGGLRCTCHRPITADNRHVSVETGAQYCCADCKIFSEDV